jgi:uncharacterized protein
MSIRTTINLEMQKVTVVRPTETIDRGRDAAGAMIAVAAPERAAEIQPNARDIPVARLEFIDTLRGFALFGVFWANLLIFSGIEYMTDGQRARLSVSSFDRLAYFCERFFIENKFMGLFSFLFGISFWLFLNRAQARVSSPTALFYRRIFWLFVIGALHGWLLWCFDILRFYALWAVLLPLFIRMSPRKLLATALSTSILVPAIVAALRVWLGPSSESGADYDAMALFAFSHGSYRDVLLWNWKYDWFLTLSISQFGYQVAIFGRLLMGLYVARTIDLSDLRTQRRLLNRIFVAGALWGLIGSTVFAGKFVTGGAVNPLLAFIRKFVVEGGQLGLTLAYASGLALAFLNPRVNKLVRLTASLGRMALTWYLLQTMFGIWIFYGFAPGPRLMGKVSAGPIALLALAGFVVQLVLARLWLSRFRFGPAEWLWRSLTYWKVQPFRSQSN